MTWCSAHSKWTNHNIDECHQNKRKGAPVTKETLQLTIPHSGLNESPVSSRNDPGAHVPGGTATTEDVAITITLPLPTTVDASTLDPSTITGLTPPDQRRKLPAVDLLIEGVFTEVLIDWGSTVNVVNPKRVKLSGTIKMGKCSIKFDGAIKSMSSSSSSLTLDRSISSSSSTERRSSCHNCSCDH